MSLAIYMIALAGFLLALNAVTGNKDHPGRLLIWLGLLWLSGFALAMPLWLIFHPQSWVLWLSCAALGVAIPTPKWIRRKDSAPARPPS